MGIAMHLSDACVDLDGNLLVKGRLSFPDDDHGLFTLPAHDWLWLRSGDFAIAPANPVRDKKSGFFLPSEPPLRVHLPDCFQKELRKSLRWMPGERLRLHYSHHHLSRLAIPKGETGEESAQLLSNWKMALRANATGGVHVQISAALTACGPLSDFQRKDDGHWGRSKGARITLTFTLDPVTRVARFGSRVPMNGWVNGPLSDKAANSTAATLNLAAAPIGQGVSLLATSPQAPEGYRWRAVNLGDYRTLSICPFRVSKNTAGGFIDGAYDVPDITIGQIGMEMIEGLLTNCDRASLEFTGDWVGRFQDHHTVNQPSDAIDWAAVSLLLDMSGLHIAYRAQLRTLSREVSDEVIISWESLILTGSRLAKKRQAVIAGRLS